MSITVEIENPANLRKARRLAGVNSDAKAVELALEEYVKDHEPQPAKRKKRDLPQSYWDDLFSDPPLPTSHSASQAVIDERNEDRF